MVVLSSSALNCGVFACVCIFFSLFFCVTKVNVNHTTLHVTHRKSNSEGCRNGLVCPSASTKVKVQQQHQTPKYYFLWCGGRTSWKKRRHPEQRNTSVALDPAEGVGIDEAEADAEAERERKEEKWTYAWLESTQMNQE